MTGHDGAGEELRDRCANCGVALGGPFCRECGQEDLDFDRPFSRLAGEWLGNLFAFDARLWRTLGPLLARPGFLSEEYLAGRRVRYVPPLRLYFFASVAMFLTLAWSGYSIVYRQSQDQNGIAAFGKGGSVEGSSPAVVEQGNRSAVAVGVSSRAEEREEDDAWIQERIENLLTRPDEVVNELYRRRLAQTLILLTFSFAWLTRGLFWRPYRRYFPHLVFSMHFHAAAFVGIVAVRAAGALAEPLVGESAAGLLGLVFLAYLAIYLFRALGRFFGRSRVSTLWRFAVLSAAHVVTLALTLMATMVLTAAFL